MNPKDLNLGLRFLLELAMLAALASWGFQYGRSPFLSVLFGLGAPLAVAAAWGLLVSPKAQLPLAEPVKLVLSLLLFGSGVLALAAAGQPALALVFAGFVVLHTVLKVLWRQ